MLADKHASKLFVLFFLGLIKCFKSFIIHDVRKKPFLLLPVGFCFLICLALSLDGSKFFWVVLAFSIFF